MVCDINHIKTSTAVNMQLTMCERFIHIVNCGTPAVQFALMYSCARRICDLAKAAAFFCRVKCVSAVSAVAVGAC